MRLLDLGAQKASLEFSPDEHDIVIARLEAYGPVITARHATHDVITVGHEELIYLNEWDEPCLIAGSATGVDILARIAAEPLASAPLVARR